MNILIIEEEFDKSKELVQALTKLKFNANSLDSVSFLDSYDRSLDLILSASLKAIQNIRKAFKYNDFFFVYLLPESNLPFKNLSQFLMNHQIQGLLIFPMNERILEAQINFLKFKLEKNRQIAQQRVHLNEKVGFYKNVFDSLSNILILYDKFGELVLANQSFIEVLKVEDPENYKNEKRFFQYIADNIVRPDSFLEKIRNLEDNPHALIFEILEFKDKRFFEFSAYSDFFGNELARICNFHDITERSFIEIKLRNEATLDSLTKLKNRSYLLERIRELLFKIKRMNDYSFAVVFLSINRFKNIKESFGHTISDQVIIEFSKRLKKIIRDFNIPGTSPVSGPDNAQKESQLSFKDREGSSGTIARLDGEEFVIIIEDISEEYILKKIFSRINESLSQLFIVGSNELFLSYSIGVAFSSPKYNSPEEILRDAHIALNRTLINYTGGVQIFDKKMYESAIKSLKLENDLRKALEKSELTFYYQPIVSLKTGKIFSFEVLIRWKHEQLGFISPMDFIPIAENSGLILPIGEKAIEEACHQIRLWNLENTGKLRVSVNVSSRQFEQKDFITKLKKTLDETKVSPEFLHIEITENVIMGKEDIVIKMLQRVKELGILIYLDDFGTGYSSLSYFSHLPIDVIKIDRSFVTTMLTNEKDRYVVISIISLAKSLGLEIVAEGVETSEQLNFLQNLECDYIQGYFFSPPLNSSDASEIIKEDKTLALSIAGNTTSSKPLS